MNFIVVNEFSQQNKVRHLLSIQCYTTATIIYIIPTFRLIDNDSLQIPADNQRRSAFKCRLTMFFCWNDEKRDRSMM